MQLSEKNPLRPDDDELLARYRADGRTEHLAQLYLRHTELVYGVALHLLRNRADAEDVVMQLFEELIVKARHHEIRNFRSWLHTVCRNLCLMRLRREGRMPPAEMPRELPDDGQLIDLLADEERRQQLRTGGTRDTASTPASHTSRRGSSRSADCRADNRADSPAPGGAVRSPDPCGTDPTAGREGGGGSPVRQCGDAAPLPGTRHQRLPEVGAGADAAVENRPGERNSGAGGRLVRNRHDRKAHADPDSSEPRPLALRRGGPRAEAVAPLGTGTTARPKGAGQILHPGRFPPAAATDEARSQPELTTGRATGHNRRPRPAPDRSRNRQPTDCGKRRPITTGPDSHPADAAFDQTVRRNPFSARSCSCLV